MVIQDEVKRLDPKDVLSVVEREKVSFLQIVGDSFARPILDEVDAGSYDLSSLFIILSGGAPLNSTLKERFLDSSPQRDDPRRHGLVRGRRSDDTSERPRAPTSRPGRSRRRRAPASSARTSPACSPPGSEEVGWVAMRGHVPLGYFGDSEKSARTFPVIDGVRYSIPGDRGRQHEDGIVEMLGRDSVTINSGGEKIFAEEVEAALGHHPAVYDAVVCGRPSEQWGQEVVAIVQLREGLDSGPDMQRDLLDECAKHIARYKLPKGFVFVDRVVRSPAGKADYRWANEVAVD